MDFLRRLAPPSIDPDRAHAVPLLSSRFASDAPLRSAPMPSEEAPVPAAASPAEAILPTRALRSPRAVSDDATRAAPLAAPGQSRKGDNAIERAEVTAAARSANRAAAAALDRPAPAHITSMAQPLPAAQSHAELAGIDAVARPRVHIDAQPALAARLPLSQQALDARVAVARPTRPVIHVTIDRIDVRAPAAPRAADPARPPRSSTLSVPLADYLRGRLKS